MEIQEALRIMRALADGVRLAISQRLLGSSEPAAEAAVAGAAGVHPGTTPGSYTITVTGAVGPVTRAVEVGLTVQ